MVHPTDGVNYYRFFLAKSSDGQVKSHDFYVFVSSELFSETMRRSFLRIGFLHAKNGNDQFWVISDPLLDAIHQESKMRKFFEAGEYEKALQIYRELPERSRTAKEVLLIRERVAQKVSREEYLDAVEDLRRYFPGEGIVDYMSFLIDFEQGEFAKALERIDRVIQLLDEDGWLLTQRSAVLGKLERLEEARSAAIKAIQIEPDFDAPYRSAMDISVLMKNYDETITYLLQLDEIFGTQFEDLADDPFYAEFVRSPQYLKWLESREASVKSPPVGPE